MAENIAGIVAARSEAMATVFLTGDLRVSVFRVGQLGQLGDVDQLAMLHTEDAGAIHKIFGVIVKGTSHPVPNARAAEKYLNPWKLSRSVKNHPTFPLPTIILLFSMYDDRGYFAWYTEPIVQGSAPKLMSHDTFTCQTTMGPAIRTIVERVSKWYDLFFDNVFVRS